VTVALVDLGMGNRRSVEKALQAVGVEPRRTADPDEVRAAAASPPGRRRRRAG